MSQVALADLLQFNPSADVNGPVAPGTSLTRPCYPANEEPTYLGMKHLCVGLSGSMSVPLHADHRKRLWFPMLVIVLPQAAILHMAKWPPSQQLLALVEQGVQWHSRLQAHKRPAH